MVGIAQYDAQVGVGFASMATLEMSTGLESIRQRLDRLGVRL